MDRRVAICIATFRRPVELSRLLRHIQGLRFSVSPPPVSMTIVVDNDPERSAEATVARLAAGSPWPVTYVAEPQPGISAARNAGLAAAPANTEFVAFIDDDEYPEPTWLDQLLHVQTAWQADAVVGPVLPDFTAASPSWASKGKFFEWQRFPTGTRLSQGRTGNALFRMECLRRLPIAFDQRFGLTGGEDHHLFMRLHLGGARIVWANEAVVRESIPGERLRVSWVLRRAFRMFSSHTICERELYPWYRVYPRRLFTGCGRICLGGFGLIPSLFMPPHIRVAMLVQMARGAGLLVGLCGWHWAEYGKRRGNSNHFVSTQGPPPD